MPYEGDVPISLTSPVDTKRSIPYRRIVLKVGTTLLTYEDGHLNLQIISTLVEQIAKIHQDGFEIVLVSSGAVAAGKHVLGAQQEENTVAFRQVLAAVGQVRLVHAYEQLFDWHHIPVAQALLSRKDMTERLGYLNVRNTLLTLLEHKVIPIINENDVVAIDELTGQSFGDNDNLSAMVANLIDADLLVMLGQVEGLFTADPNLDPQAQLIPSVDGIDSVEAVGGISWKDRGRGGMATKLQAAKIARSAGADVIIASGLKPNIMVRLSQGEQIGTFFPATNTHVESRKRWMLSGLSTKGEIVIDAGASSALQKHNRSLLPAGVSKILGSFERGDIVSVLNSKRHQVAVGITNYGSTEINAIKGSCSDRIEELLGYHYGDEILHRNNMVVL